MYEAYVNKYMVYLWLNSMGGNQEKKMPKTPSWERQELEN